MTILGANIVITITIVIVMVCIMHRRSKKQKKQLQQIKNDAEIEQRILEKSVDEILCHSNHERAAEIFVQHLKQLIQFGAGPHMVYAILKKHDLLNTVIGPKTEQEKFRSMVQRLVVEKIDDHDMQCWMIYNKAGKEDWRKLNGSILSKVHKNGFIWDLQLS